MNPWDAEVPVTPELAARLVRTQFPSLLGEVRRLGTGWDNDVFTVGPSLAFRFPRRAEALPLQLRELAVLPLVADLGLPVPSPVFHGAPAEAYPWPFWGGPLVPGDELCHVSADRSPLAVSLGDFLSRLHALDVGVDLPHDPMRRGDPSHRGALARDTLAELAAAGLVDGPPYPVLDEGAQLGASETRVLVHGDLHLRHVLAHPDGTAGGVIDWGDSCFADPSVDLSFAFGALSGPARVAFFAAYGEIDTETELRARVLAVQLCAMLASYAHDVCDEPLLTESVAGIGRAQS